MGNSVTRWLAMLATVGVVCSSVGAVSNCYVAADALDKSSFSSSIN